MRKTIIMMAAGLALASVVAAPAVATPGPKAPKPPKAAHGIGGAVTLAAPSPAAGQTTTTATGNVKARASCRKGRTVHLTLSKADGSAASSEVVTKTGPNGDFTATITAPAQPAPIPPATTSPPTTYTLNASVDQLNRKSGKGKRARKFVCKALTATPVTITVS
ncbi:MAG: hypothetical protein ACXWDT_01175 [Solirubrobacterales bacterium]